MSSLKAARADNFYFPAGWNPQKGTLSHYQKMKKHQHQPPEKRTEPKKFTIRYQTPFHIRCLNCKNMIAKGVRFNADKKSIDKFYSTIIWQFSMKCPHCNNKIVSVTDPENCQYKYTQGAYRIFSVNDCTDQSRIFDPQKWKTQHDNPFSRLQVTTADLKNAKVSESQIQDLYRQKRRDFYDLELNRKARKLFKIQKELKQKEDKFKEQNHYDQIQLKLQEIDKINQIQFKTFKVKKECTKMTQREILKQKLSKMHPNFKRCLKKQLKQLKQKKMFQTFKIQK